MEYFGLSEQYLAVDFLKDMAMLRITYDGKSPQEIDRLLKFKQAQLTEF